MSGLDMPMEAFSDLAEDNPRLRFVHVFSCERDPGVLKYLKYTLSSSTRLYTDVRKRREEDMMYVDVYIAGPPCQGFSLLNSGADWTDPRSQLFVGALKYIKEARPKVAILENVATLATSFKNIRRAVVKFLRMANYTVKYNAMNSSDHFLPQSRHRLYIVAIRKVGLENVETVFTVFMLESFCTKTLNT